MAYIACSVHVTLVCDKLPLKYCRYAGRYIFERSVQLHDEGRFLWDGQGWVSCGNWTELVNK